MQLGTQGGCPKMPFLKVAALISMVATAACSGPEASFSHKNVAKKRVKCLFLYLNLNTTLQIGTSTINKNVICLEKNWTVKN